MADLVGEGTEQDPRHLPLFTKAKKRVPNQMPLEVSSPQLMAFKEIHGDAHPDAEFRSISATYNCVGMVFATRRTWVEDPHASLNKVVYQFMFEDGYTRVTEKSDVRVGDVVIYKQSGQAVHVGFVASVRADVEQASFQFKIMSKWGQCGEYVHLLEDTPDHCRAEEVEFWSDRRDC